jgi:hypothetical protein
VRRGEEGRSRWETNERNGIEARMAVRRNREKLTEKKKEEANDREGGEEGSSRRHEEGGFALLTKTSANANGKGYSSTRIQTLSSPRLFTHFYYNCRLLAPNRRPVD